VSLPPKAIVTGTPVTAVAVDCEMVSVSAVAALATPAMLVLATIIATAASAPRRAQARTLASAPATVCDRNIVPLPWWSWCRVGQ
jgi:hypothetical protein